MSENRSLDFTPATDDVEVDVYSQKELAAAILAVQPGHATVITLHRASGGTTRFIFNWRRWRRALCSSRQRHTALRGRDEAVQDYFLSVYARRVRKLPKECFQ